MGPIFEGPGFRLTYTFPCTRMPTQLRRNAFFAAQGRKQVDCHKTKTRPASRRAVQYNTAIGDLRAAGGVVGARIVRIVRIAHMQPQYTEANASQIRGGRMCMARCPGCAAAMGARAHRRGPRKQSGPNLGARLAVFSRP